ncbi:Cationic peroxidase 1 isoform B [Glycine soja]|uniref:peroxidase n=1 Tax=Glycine soja TaxID=3848 RepID=A0A445L7F4_GLYSO|nr:Cationic peroxidase 1 isoform B [Glycine soja]
MASRGYFFVVLHALVFASIATSAFSQLSPNYYDYSCPKALSTIKSVVEASVQKERRMGASLLRLHFHDCFVNGCDGSILLDSTSSIDSEKNAAANLQSARGFEVVDDIKKAVDEACGKPVVSCADILAVAARDSVVALGGPSWKVRLGRRDSTTASREAADASIPAPFFSLSELITNFKNHGLDEKDLVVLSGGHSIGFARCVTFKDHIYNDSNIDPHFAQQLKYICPTNGGDSNLSPLDSTAAKFDINYYSNLVQKKGLLHSDQELFNGGSTDELVKEYSDDTEDFYEDFANSMIKMGNIQSLTGNQGMLKALESRFAPAYYDDPSSTLFKLQQQGFVNDYLTEFERLAYRICKLALQPSSLTQAAALAKLQETKLLGHHQNYYSPPSPRYQAPLNPNSPFLKPNTTLAPKIPFERLTSGEMALRRDHGRFYHCDDKWIPGHHCKPRLHLLIADEDIEPFASHLDAPSLPSDNFDPLDLDLDRYPIPQISLHAIDGTVTPDTFRQYDLPHQHHLVILVDEGSTHNFIQSRVTHFLYFLASPSDTLRVMVDDDYMLDCTTSSQQLPLSLTSSNCPLVVQTLSWAFNG